jgi:hypothetical protein
VPHPVLAATAALFGVGNASSLPALPARKTGARRENCIGLGGSGHR